MVDIQNWTTWNYTYHVFTNIPTVFQPHKQKTNHWDIGNSKIFAVSMQDLTHAFQHKASQLCNTKLKTLSYLPAHSFIIITNTTPISTNQTYKWKQWCISHNISETFPLHSHTTHMSNKIMMGQHQM